MKRTNKLIVIIFLLSLIHCASAQTGQPNPSNNTGQSALTTDTTANPLEAKLFLISKVYKDSIVLRWGPDKAIAWRLANKYGYVIERNEILRDGQPYKDSFRRITANPLKPWSQAQWAKYPAESNKYAAVAKQSLYGEPDISSLKPGPITDIGNMADKEQMIFFFSLFAADMDAVAAKGLALRYSDKDIRPGSKYIYMVHTLVPSTEFKVDTSFIIVNL